jgi:hypothetical protein
MSRRSALAPAGFRPLNLATDLWGEIDTSLIEGVRGEIPVFPVHILSGAWGQWLQDTAASSGSPLDYVAQSLLATVAAVTGGGVIAEVTPSWKEPVVLWQVLVGAPSSGKSPALAAARRLLGPIEAELRAADGERKRVHETKIEQARLLYDKWKCECEAAIDRGVPPPVKPAEAAFDEAFVAHQIVVSDATIESLADVVFGNTKGVILWRDELAAWFCNMGRYSNGSDRPHFLEAWAAGSVTINRKSRSGPLNLSRFPVSIIGTIQPDRLTDALTGADDGMAARFLYVWPDPPQYHSILDRRLALDDDAQSRLRRIAGLAGTSDNPAVLRLSADALVVLNTFLSELHAEAQNHEGLEAGFLGKGRGTVVRLAAVLTLLRWSETETMMAPSTIDVDAIRDAAGLWADYMRPHARAVFNRAGSTGRDKHARRTIRWIQAVGVEELSREDVRCTALGRALDADGADQVIARLVAGHVLREMPASARPNGGRPARRWAVNPGLAQLRAGKLHA